jgi:hypothetical protein
VGRAVMSATRVGLLRMLSRLRLLRLLSFFIGR